MFSYSVKTLTIGGLARCTYGRKGMRRWVMEMCEGEGGRLNLPTEGVITYLTYLPRKKALPSTRRRSHLDASPRAARTLESGRCGFFLLEKGVTCLLGLPVFFLSHLLPSTIPCTPE